MTQEYLTLEQGDETPPEDEALIVCKSCVHLVPKTMMCIYCGAPLLYKPR